MVRYIAPLVVFGLLVLVFVKGLDPERDINALPSPFLGKPAPEFDLPALKNPGERVGTANYDGEVTLVNVWATWCVGCRQEHDFLLDLARRHEVRIDAVTNGVLLTEDLYRRARGT